MDAGRKVKISKMFQMQGVNIVKFNGFTACLQPYQLPGDILLLRNITVPVLLQLNYIDRISAMLKNF